MKLSERMRDTEKLNIPHIVPVDAVMEYADDVAALEDKLEAMDAKLLHCEAHDETAWEFPHGENLVWDALTDEQKVYWKALVGEKA